MAGVRRFEDLTAWRLAVELRDAADEVCRRARARRDFAFFEQLRDSARSGPRNIAEGFGRFRHREFARFVRIAIASEHEVLNHFRDAESQGYMSAAELAVVLHTARKALKTAIGLARYLESTPDR